VVNLIHKILKELDWNYCVNKRGQTGYTCSEEPSRLFEGNCYKLHGNMEHAERKGTYFGFDKNPNCALVCTDVASRGLDFKGVSWVVHFDLSSKITEYVNRTGRTARMANSGQSICFVMEPNEEQYVPHMKKEFGIEMHNKSRFTLAKLFE
jgi:superfamily II DNA/RNA helicase